MKKKNRERGVLILNIAMIAASLYLVIRKCMEGHSIEAVLWGIVCFTYLFRIIRRPQKIAE